jgi:hypothetical protein
MILLILSGPQCRAPSIHLHNGDASSLPPAIDKEQLIKIYRQEQEVENKHIGKSKKFFSFFLFSYKINFRFMFFMSK